MYLLTRPKNLPLCQVDFQVAHLEYRLGSVAGLIATEAVIGAVYVFLGYQLLLFMERESRKRASLEVA